MEVRGEEWRVKINEHGEMSGDMSELRLLIQIYI